MKAYLSIVVLVAWIAQCQSSERKICVEIKLISYRNPGRRVYDGTKCDHSLAGGCDTEFYICIDKLDSHDVADDLNKCAYFRHEIEEIDHMDDFDTLYFDDTLPTRKNKKRSIKNPIVFCNVTELTNNGSIVIRLKVDTKDDDSGPFNPDDLIDKLHQTIWITPDMSKDDAKIKQYNITGNRDRAHPTTLITEISGYMNCSKYFYGTDCSTYCKPQDSKKHGHYTCDPYGDKVCMPGYGGNGCYDKIDDKDLNNIPKVEKSTQDEDDGAPLEIIIPLIVIAIIILAVILAILWRRRQSKKQRDAEMQASVGMHSQGTQGSMSNGSVVNPTYTNGAVNPAFDHIDASTQNYDNVGRNNGGTQTDGAGAVCGIAGKQTDAGSSHGKKKTDNIYGPTPGNPGPTMPISAISGTDPSSGHVGAYSEGPSSKGEDLFAANVRHSDIYEDVAIKHPPSESWS